LRCKNPRSRPAGPVAPPPPGLGSLAEALLHGNGKAGIPACHATGAGVCVPQSPANSASCVCYNAHCKHRGTAGAAPLRPGMKESLKSPATHRARRTENGPPRQSPPPAKPGPVSPARRIETPKRRKRRRPIPAAPQKARTFPHPATRVRLAARIAKFPKTMAKTPHGTRNRTKSETPKKRWPKPASPQKAANPRIWRGKRAAPQEAPNSRKRWPKLEPAADGPAGGQGAGCRRRLVRQCPLAQNENVPYSAIRCAERAS